MVSSLCRRLTLSRDGDGRIDEDRVLVYTENRPNGSECGPVCRQANVELGFVD